MDYDFSLLCNDQIETIIKRLESFKKTCISDYILALNVINNPSINIKSIEISVEDIFNDNIKEISILYTQCMNKVQNLLLEDLR